MAYLNVDLDYFEHPKTKRLVRLLGKGSEVLPLKLWVYTARYFAKDGRLTGMTAQEIEDECRWWGEPGRMLEAMLDAGSRFVEADGDTFVVHQWLDHQGHLSAFTERARRGAEARWAKYRAEKEDASSNATSNASSNAPTLPTIPTNTPLPPAGELAGFNQFWQAWPRHERKGDKSKCLKAWKSRKLEPITDRIVSAVQWWRRSVQWGKDNGRFIPSPLVWLNKELWLTAEELQAPSTPKPIPAAQVPKPQPTMDESARRQDAEELRRLDEMPPEEVASLIARWQADFPLKRAAADPRQNASLRRFILARAANKQEVA